MKLPRTPAPKHGTSPGFALVTTMILLAGCTILVVGYLSISRNEILSARSYADAMRAETAAAAGFEEVKALLMEFTDNDDYIVTMSPNRSTIGTAGGGDGDDDTAHSNNYYFISQPQDDGTVDHVPLFAGGRMHTTTVHEGPTWRRDPNLDPANGVLGTMSEFLLGSTDEEPIQIQKTPWTSWLRPGGQSADPNDRSGIRYTYWVEDLQGQLQYDKAGYQWTEVDNDVTTAENPWWKSVAPVFGQGNPGKRSHWPMLQAGKTQWTTAPGLNDSILLGFQAGDPRHGGQQMPGSWFASFGNQYMNGGRVLHQTARDPNYGHFRCPGWLRSPFLGPGAAFQNKLADQMAPGLSVKEMACSFQYHYWSEHTGLYMATARAGGVLSNSSLLTGWGGDNHVYGLRPYLERQRIPKGFGYDTSVDPDGAGTTFQPGDRGNLNVWVGQGDATGAGNLAGFLSNVMPTGWAQRGGGIATSLGSNNYSQTYLRALAANIVDYADEDSIPTRDQAGMTRGFMRGVEALPMVNEVAWQFRWISKELYNDSDVVDRTSSATKWRIEIRATPYIEFWNPTNQEVDANPGNGVVEPVKVGLVYWDTPGGGAPTRDSRIANHCRLRLAHPYYPDEPRMGPGSTDDTGMLVDITRGQGGPSVMNQSDLILWEDVSIPPNGYKVHAFEPVVYVFEIPAVPDPDNTDNSPVPFMRMSHIDFGGENANGTDFVNASSIYDNRDYASRVAMVLADSGTVSQTVEDHRLYDEWHGGMYRRLGKDWWRGRMIWHPWHWWSGNPGHNSTIWLCHHAAHDCDGTDDRSNVGDPYSSFYLTNVAISREIRESSFGGRNYRFDIDNNGENTDAGWSLPDGWNDRTMNYWGWERFGDHGGGVYDRQYKAYKEVRPSYWPDGGYDTLRGTRYPGWNNTTKSTYPIGQGPIPAVNDKQVADETDIPGPPLVDGYFQPERNYGLNYVQARLQPDRVYPGSSGIDTKFDTWPDGLHPDEGNNPAAWNAPSAPLMAPFRLNNTGRYWSITELGNVWDPSFWYKYMGPHIWNWRDDFWPVGDWTPANPLDALHSRVGGGNTLRIGRPEHRRFRINQSGHWGTPTGDDWLAMKLLDVFAVGTNGSNVGRVQDPATPDDLDSGADEWDPEWHIDPPSARNASEAADTSYPYYHVWGPDLHAESPYRYINGLVNYNTTVFGWAAQGTTLQPYCADPGYGLNHTDPYAIPGQNGVYPWGEHLGREAEGGVNWENWGMNRWGPWLSYRRYFDSVRPFYAPSQFAAIWNNYWADGPGFPAARPLNEWPTENDGNDRELGATQIGDKDKLRDQSARVHMSDATREEQFARMFNLCNLSSRNFRIWVHGEYLAPNGQPMASARKVYEVFAKPVRGSNGLVSQVKIEVITERDY